MVATSLEAAYRAHAAELIRFATAVVGPDAASDVVTEAMVRVFDRSVDGAGIANVRAMLFKSVYRQAIDHESSRTRPSRRERRYVDRSTRHAPADEADGGDQHEGEEAQQERSDGRVGEGVH